MFLESHSIHDVAPCQYLAVPVSMFRSLEGGP
jgi:hypothetical protein